MANFFSPIAPMCHFNIVHAIKPPNLIDLLNWQFAAMSVENRGNGHTWRMPAGFNRRYPTSQISAILYADRGDRRESQSLHCAAPRRWACKIAWYVAGFTQNTFSLDCANFSKINLLLTEREGRTGESWPEVVAVRTERS